MATTKPTPPHHPTYHVQFSDTTIQSIILNTLPKAEIDKIEQLESGKSFNNRLYFITTTISATESTQQQNDSNQAETPTKKLELVLKVSGQFFGPAKVQNEVSCLFILRRYCPDIPVPHVLAWSENGSEMKLPLDVPQCKEVIDGTNGRGWILMTRRPGRLITAADVTGPHGSRLIAELALFVSLWRKEMHTAMGIGNLRILQDSGDLPLDSVVYTTESVGYPGSIVQGLLLTTMQPSQPLNTRESYYRHKVKNQLNILESEEVFSANRGLVVPLVKSFFDNEMSALPLFSARTGDSITFTHYDLSPRNILVSESNPPSISGIVDFEFAGFFPEEEEFTNTLVHDPDDWPGESYNQFMQELENRGVPTPLQSMDKKKFDQACTLYRLVENIAPWWLREGGTRGDELAKELDKAAQLVQEAVSYLLQSINNS